jgi:Zn-dependent protease
LFGLGPNFIFNFVAVVVGLTIHEFAHAWSADLLGDRTARMAGRVTLNPLAHLEPLGLIMILFAPIGWAKPTPVNGSNFRKPKFYHTLVAAAGPLSNLLIAIVSIVTIVYLPLSGFVLQLANAMVVVNIALFIFNLIPIQPLDGSRIVSNLLPYRYEVIYRKLDLYGPFILLLIVMIPTLRNNIISPLFYGTISFILSWFGFGLHM